MTSAQTLALDRGKARADRQHRLSRHRDRALIGLLVYSFARIGAALGMAVEDVYTQNRRLWVTPREKGGKRHRIPCHQNLEEHLNSYFDGASLCGDPKGPLFCTIGRGTGMRMQ